jgi:hypothetical protein
MRVGCAAAALVLRHQSAVVKAGPMADRLPFAGLPPGVIGLIAVPVATSHAAGVLTRGRQVW